ncbi:MAG: LLM class flavin-dependent oxidoreductase [Bauldia litoralis]
MAGDQGSTGDLSFGICIGAVDAPGTGDADLYRCCIEDAGIASDLGYDGVWALEHHFSNYYPTPSPLMLLSHVAALWPHLELGSMVLVAPWYQPLRLAEEISMLSLLTRSSIHLGLGRGSAPMEYDAFGMDLDESRGRFEEVVEIVLGALSGGPFSYSGDYYQVPHPIELRPKPDRGKINLYGAISSPGTAEIMARLGLPMFCNAIRPMDMHRQVLEAWAKTTSAMGRPAGGVKLLQAHIIVEDTDEEADRQARELMPQFFQAQVEHYAADLTRYDHVESFDLHRMHADRERLSKPENLDGFIQMQLFGSPETVARKLQAYRDVGFNKFVVTTNTPGIPKQTRHRWLTRFAQEVRPAFSRPRAAASRELMADAQ